MPRILSTEERAAKLARQKAARAEAAAARAAAAVVTAKKELVAEARSAAAREAAAAERADELAMDVAAEKFFELLSQGWSVTKSARGAGLAVPTVYHRRKVSPKFQARWDLAKEIARGVIEDEILTRAVKGWQEPVFQGGKLVGHKTVKSDYLLMKRAEADMPERYRDRKVIHTGSDGGPLKVQHEVVARLTDRLSRLGGDGVMDMAVGADGVARVSE